MPTKEGRRKYAVLFSGGLDSTVLVSHLLYENCAVHCFSVNYGQRHHCELAYAERIATDLGVEHTLLPLSALGPYLNGSALTDLKTPVPEGHYTQENMKTTVVPNRNLIMLSIVSAIAISKGYDGIAIAVHAGDHAIYPDCRPAFIELFKSLLFVSAEVNTSPSISSNKIVPGMPEFDVYAPFLHMPKHDIVKRGVEVSAPMDKTWSCYKGGGGMVMQFHCGRCGTCVERHEAFALAGVEDSTKYMHRPPVTPLMDEAGVK